MAEENSSSASRSKGVVTRFNDQKGYGFILPEEGGDDLFVHHSAIKSDGYRTLREGQTVEFTIILDGDKTKAVDVTAPGGAPIDNNSSRRFGNGSSSHSRGGNGVDCFNCGELGHLARDCANGRGNGGYNGGGGGSGCYNCGGRGHIARECPSAPRGSGGGGGACFNCGDVGHMARDCTRGRVGGGGGGGGRFTRGGGGGGNGNCFNCGESGHYARDCNEIVM